MKLLVLILCLSAQGAMGFLSPPALTAGRQSRCEGAATVTASMAWEGDRRKALLASGALILGLGGKKADRAEAAFPSVSDYETGSGTVVRDVNPKEKESLSPVDVSPSSSAELQACMAATAASLSAVRGFVDKMAWDNVREALQTSPPGQKFVKPNRPAIVMKPLDSPCSLDSAAAKSFEKYRKECSQSLMELSDFAFTNRVIFFNAEDKASVARLAGNVEVDLDEAQGYLDSALESFVKMQAIVNAIPK